MRDAAHAELEGVIEMRDAAHADSDRSRPTCATHLPCADER